MPPPPLPEDVLARVRRIARYNGASVLVVAGFFALLQGAAHDFTMAMLCLAAAGAGAAERHGAARLGAGDPAGVRWLVGSQLYLLLVIDAYALFRVLQYDPALIQRALQVMLETPMMRIRMEESGMTEADLFGLVRVSYFLVYAILALVTLAYQGGLAFYYHRRRPAILRAIAGE